MPAVSKKQFKFMAAVAHGGIKKPGLSSNKAKEFVDNVNYKSLPNKVGKNNGKANSSGKEKTSKK